MTHTKDGFILYFLKQEVSSILELGMWPHREMGGKPEFGATLDPTGFLTLGSGVSFLLGCHCLVLAS